MTIFERLWRLLPDKCEGIDCDRLGVRGNENRVNGKILCDYCHAKVLTLKRKLEVRDANTIR